MRVCVSNITSNGSPPTPRGDRQVDGEGLGHLSHECQSIFAVLSFYKCLYYTLDSLTDYEYTRTN